MYHRGRVCVRHKAQATCQRRTHVVLCARKYDYKGDVIIIGAGVIGLFIASRILERGLGKVVLVESAQGLCGGATGAGQGYIWQCHRDPLSLGAWKMAEQSKQEWKDILSLTDVYDENGSLLLATTENEAIALQERVDALKAQGVHAEYLSSHEEIVRVEPSLRDSRIQLHAGVVTQNDAQIDGRRAVDVLFSRCASYGKEHFISSFGHAAESLIVSGGCVKGVVLDDGRAVHGDHVIVAAGAWSGRILSKWLDECAWKERILPRRGHLLVCATPGKGIRQLRHGIMEAKYTKHYSNVETTDDYDVTFTATENGLDGSLLIGSSRELLMDDDAWAQDAQPHVVNDILQRARLFLPHLLDDRVMTLRETRVGLRPFATSHHAPYIGPVQGISGLYVSSGHEGSGLTLGPATADVVIHRLFHTGLDAHIDEYTHM